MSVEADISRLSYRTQLKLLQQPSEGMEFDNIRVWIGEYLVSLPNRLRGVQYDDETGEAF